MTKATYFVEGQSRELFVLSENPDGTFELGDDKGSLIIGKCPTDPKQPGYCVVKASEPTKPEAPKTPKEPKAKE